MSGPDHPEGDGSPSSPTGQDLRATFAGFDIRREAPLPPPDPWRRWRRGALAVVILVAFGGFTAVLLSEKAAREDREAAELRRAVAAERARLTRIQAPHQGAARKLRPARGAAPGVRRAARAALVDAVERAITADARVRARTGELDGPIRATECGPIARRPDAVPDDRLLAKRRGRYDCVAVKADVRQGGRSVGRLGHAFVAALDFQDFTYVWCRNTPPQSERGEALVSVRLDRRCLAATGAALGTGYIDEP